MIFHMCDETSHTTDYHLLDPVEQFFSEKILTCVQKLKEENVKDFTTPYLLWMQGHDSSAPNPLIPRIIEEANKLLKEDRLIHSSLPAYIEKLKGAVKELKVLKGEMRSSNKDGSSTVLLGDVLSTRMHLKQINARVENKLQKWAEPFATFAWILGKEYPNFYLEKAWKYLLANHAHDSIGGCSTDKVQEDMVYRFRQSEEISENLLLRSFQHIVRLINNSDLGEEDISLMVFNCLPFERTEVASVVLDFPQDFEMKFFSIFDQQGNEIPLQITSKEKTQPILHQLLDSASHLDVERVKCHFLAQSIPPLGYKTFLIKSHKEGAKRNFGSLVLASNTMENEYLWVKINSDGTLKIKDKSTGKVFDNLGFFEDSGENGNSWQRVPPMCDRIITSSGGNSSIALIEDGSLVATFRIQVKMSLPESVTADRMRRSEREKEYLITSLATLRKGAKRVDIITKLDNNVKDHRLRVMFPTRTKAQFACAEGGFDVLQRPIKHLDTSQWVESSMKTHPQLSFVDVSDGEIGLAIINEGLREYEVLDDPFRTIALTFLRCFPFKIWINSEMAIHPEGKGSQCLGNHKFRYAIYPHRGDWKDGDVFRQAYQHNAPLRMAQCGQGGGNLPKEMSFIEIQPSNLIISALKKSEREESIIVRLFNPTDMDLEGKISCCKKIKKVRLVNLNEEPIKDIKINSHNVITLPVKKKKIVTLELIPGFL